MIIKEKGFLALKNSLSFLWFQENQKDLENATETLSEYLERDITSDALAEIKQKVQDKSRYCSSRLFALTCSLLFSLIPFWTPAGITIAGLPFLTYAFLNLRNDNGSYKNWVILFYYQIYNVFYHGGMFVVSNVVPVQAISSKSSYPTSVGFVLRLW